MFVNLSRKNFNFVLFFVFYISLNQNTLTDIPKKRTYQKKDIPKNSMSLICLRCWSVTNTNASFRSFLLMGLSGLDSKKYQAILNFRRQLPKSPSGCIISEHIEVCNKQIDEYGELAVNRLTQTPKEFSEAELQEIISLYQAGKATRELGEMFKVSKNTIGRLLKEQGVEITRSKAQAKLNAKKAISMYEDGFTSTQIAKQLGVGAQTILRCLKNHGVTIKSRWDYEQK